MKLVYHNDVPEFDGSYVSLLQGLAKKKEPPRERGLTLTLKTPVYDKLKELAQELDQSVRKTSIQLITLGVETYFRDKEALEKKKQEEKKKK